MAQLQNPNTHKMAPRGEKENGAIFCWNIKRVQPIEKNHPTLKWEGRWRNSFWAYVEPGTDPKFNLNGAMLPLGLKF